MGFIVTSFPQYYKVLMSMFDVKSSCWKEDCKMLQIHAALHQLQDIDLTSSLNESRNWVQMA